MDIKFSKLDELISLVTTMIKNKIKVKTLIPNAKEDVKENFKINKIECDYHENINTVSETDTKYNIEEQTLDFEEYVVNDDLTNDTNDDLDLEDKEKTERLPILYPVGLVWGTYIICQNEIGMYLIDQHAAKERVNYEIFKASLATSNTKMPMLVPLTLEIPNNEYIILEKNMNMLTNMGFTIEEFGLNTIIVKEHPTWIKDNANEVIKRIIEAVINREKDFNLQRFNDHLAATLACKASIKANTSITMDEAKKLIEDLRKCDNPFNCPHGRPTIITYTKSDLEKLFKRSGF